MPLTASRADACACSPHHPFNAGVHLHDMPYGSPGPYSNHWRNNYRGPNGIPADQLLSPSGMKLALHGLLAVPYLKKRCNTAFAAARMPGGSIRDFFWAAHEGLAAQLQHGASVEQGSTQEAAVVMRKCMVSCAHVACMLVTVYHMLLDGPHQQQQQQAASGGGAAAAGAAGGGDGGVAQHPAAGMQQQQRGMLPCELLCSAEGEEMVALQAAHRTHQSAAVLALDRQQQQQQQEPPAHLPSKPLLREQRAAAFVALDATAAAAAAGGLFGDVASLAAARQAAGNPLPLVPPLVAHGGQGQGEQELLLLDGASLRVLVRRLCPPLDALLALTPSNEGNIFLPSQLFTIQRQL